MNDESAMNDDAGVIALAPTTTPGNLIAPTTTPGNLLILSTAGPKEVLRFEANGDVYVRGEKVDSNKEIYEAFKAWLVECGALGQKP